MGQTTAGTQLTTNAAATSRKIGVRFRCDWADDGFASLATWTDESAYVKSVSGTMEAIGMRRPIAAVGRGVANVVRVVCQNPECSGGDSGFRFSPSNTNGTLYATIGEGKVNMMRAQLEMVIYDGAVAERHAKEKGRSRIGARHTRPRWVSTSTPSRGRRASPRRECCLWSSNVIAARGWIDG